MRARVAALLLLGVATSPALAQDIAGGPAGAASMFSAAIFRSTVIPVHPVTLQGVQPAEMPPDPLATGEQRLGVEQLERAVRHQRGTWIIHRIGTSGTRRSFV